MGSTLYQGQQLIALIKDLVGSRGEWQSIDPYTGFPVVIGEDGQPRALLPGEQVNDVRFFAPAQAIIVKGTSRITPRFRPPYPATPAGGGGGLGKANDDKPDNARVVIAPKADPDKNDGRVVIAPKKDPNVRVLGDGDKRADDAKKGRPLDPKAIWQEALAKGVEDPGIIIAVAEFLARLQLWDHVAEFLKADLRQGIVVKPWVYEALAVALRSSGGAAEEIERAELSSVDLQPTDAQGFLKAARTMGDLKRFDRALAFCKQASLLEPNTPYPYAQALNYANATDDLEAVQWATSNLLKQDWPVRNQDIQLKATDKLNEVFKLLQQQNRMDESKQLREAVEERRRRDLVVKLSWQGQADLDLKVKEPTGSTCWALNRVTVGGGTLVGDTLADFNHETYLAAEAFSGEYEITIDRVWGHPVSEKAQLRILRHQGTKDEREELIAVDLSDLKLIKIKLDNGRRTEAAYVPPPSSQQTPDASLVPQSQHDKILVQLRDLADPENYNYVQNRGFNGGLGSSGAATGPSETTRSVGKIPDASPNDRVMYQTKVSSFVSNSLDVTAQAVMSADRRSVRLSIAPVFAPLPATSADPKVASSVIP
jgi:tetratricopeptide (TPR) repeat protein